MSPIPPYPSSSVDEVVDGAPVALDTLNELAAAIADDPNFAQTVTALIQGAQDALQDHIADPAGAHASSAISYDNTASGLFASEVQEALDELALSGGGGGVHPFAPVATISSLPATLDLADRLNLVTVGNGMVTLPSSAPTNTFIRVKDHAGVTSTDPITVRAPLGETIDAAPSIDLDADYTALTFVKVSSTEWIVA